MALARTAATTPARKPERISYDEAAAHAVLDATVFCSVATIVDGRPSVLPQLHVRIGHTLYLHGSTASTTGLAARAGGIAVCVSVSIVDAFRLARSALHHSVDARSVVVHGSAAVVADPADKERALAALLDAVAPGRAAGCRPPTARELAQTSVLALPLVEVSLKVRSHGVADDEADLALAHWAGRLPIRLTAGAYEPAPDLAAGIPAPPPHPLQA